DLFNKAHGMVCVVGRMRDLILQLSKSSIYSTKPSLCQISGHARATLKNKSLINIPLILLASSKSKIRLIAFVDY
ncbi:hypothetical protein CQA89_29760, partial [Klebsiella pneumoniae]